MTYLQEIRMRLSDPVRSGYDSKTGRGLESYDGEVDGKNREAD